MKLPAKDKELSLQQAAKIFEVPEDALHRRVNWTLQALPADASRMNIMGLGILVVTM